ncbi:MAG: AmmeMemoRadiSam system protein B [Spirochaetota bacterium]
MSIEYPKIRPVEAIPAQENLICLRDPMGISDKLIFLPHDLFFIVSLFDGNHSILDIQTAYTRRYGTLLFSSRIRELIEKLDSLLFLESSRFEEARKNALEEYRKAPLRKASHAGVAYEKEKNALLKQLNSFFKGPDGPGLPERAQTSEEALINKIPEETISVKVTPTPPSEAAPSMEVTRTTEPDTKLTGLIAPHIDLIRGGKCFAWSYSELLKRCRAKTFIILGISHVQTNRRFVLTEKDFETPLGVVPADREFINGLRRRFTMDFFEDELVHRNEHSVEFQALFLRYIYPDEERLRIVPILCSSRDEIISGYSPSEDPEFSEFLSALKAECSERDDELCLIAGVDLSHLGQRFGQNISMTPAVLKKAEIDDMKMIQLILNRDAEGFMHFIQEEKDRRNVCGVPAIYTLLKLINAKEAKLLRYDQAVDMETSSVVTFMGTAFYR